MAEFKPIETQEAFDTAIKERLERHTKSVTADVAKKYEGYLSPDEKKKLTDRIDALTVQLKDKETSISELTAKNNAYKIASVRQKIAHEKGIPYELADKLSGETEEEITADAETFAKFVSGTNHRTQPLFSNDNAGSEGGKEAAFKSMLSELRKDG